MSAAKLCMTPLRNGIPCNMRAALMGAHLKAEALVLMKLPWLDQTCQLL